MRAAPDLELAPVLDMRQSRELKRQLEQLLDRGGPVILDGERVARVSTGCIQILVSFVATMTRAGLSVTLLRPSDVLTQSFCDLGLAETLNACKAEMKPCAS